MSDMTLGDVEVTRVEELHGPVGMTPDVFFPGSPKEDWDEHRPVLVPDFLNDETGICEVAVQTWVLRSEGKTILIDTGVGNHKERPYAPAWGHLELDFLGNLERAGVRPDDVDIVVNTHLHVDHVGWNTRLEDRTWVPTFRNATYLMPKADFEFWNPANNPKIAGGVNQNVFEDSVAPVHAAGQVLLWETGHEIDANLRLRATPGHTPGSSVVMLASGSEHAVFVGDLMHSPFQVMRPEHNSCFCEDAPAARRTRREILGRAADSNALVLPAHFAGHGALEVERSGGSFGIKRWAPFDRL
ncbi:MULTISPECIES: MBL fold metallo-hydrolase [Streptomyces]|uniref:MBL fold metallo-hydrolase n=2 Tax=Streptomyces TaxID=1883 RepID=A0A3M8F433_9ACTN|nr:MULTISPECIES: MBL fold metallo-hydrolase [Streptomyces]KNE84260.1 beta-lactamase [Streptomyces fradiae]OFA58514.1 MBL fold metallo-hydrolase [Streptomyces fradiae]PQM22111.1 MBL fold metallo-hydrolase [Streptomyces xinghaiensis]RKM95361.1 MBL fold metallo-hydrolase [Streptomyces xinghaiensis]RNC72945.1 MBL fold metallo-hydrolase [Streptomyces xinghaiensis]